MNKYFKLYLQNKPYDDIPMGCFKTENEVFNEINRWLNRKNYHAHYFRQWTRGNKTYIDFGD